MDSLVISELSERYEDDDAGLALAGINFFRCGDVELGQLGLELSVGVGLELEQVLSYLFFKRASLLTFLFLDFGTVGKSHSSNLLGRLKQKKE